MKRIAPDQWKRTALVVAALTLLSTSVVVTSQTNTTPATEHKGGASGPMGGDMGQMMMRNMQQMQSMPMTGDTDRDFASMMKMHHQGAIDMAQAELRSGRDPKLREMAKKIIASQQQEIKEFDAWLAQHKQAGGQSGHK